MIWGVTNNYELSTMPHICSPTVLKGAFIVQLAIQNVGKILNATVKIDGITVIAGNNNTGKSTIGKVLYCLYEGFYDLENRVIRSRVNAIIRELSAKSPRRRPLRERQSLISELVAVIAEADDVESAVLRIWDILSPHLGDSDVDTDIRNDFFERIRNALLLPDFDIKRDLIQSVVRDEFGDSVAHVNHSTPETSFELTIKGEILKLSFDRNMLHSFAQPFDIYSQAILIDTPIVLDDIPGNYWLSARHRDALIGILSDDDYRASEDNSDNSVSRILIEKKLSNVYEKLSQISKGKFIKAPNGEMQYKEDGLTKGLDMSSLSNGMKSFLIIRKLLENGYLREKGVLIFDEPEIHLHPEWQLAFAEVIVLLQKEFDLSVVVTTHSAYFLFAIEVFSARHGIADKCNYYLSEIADDNSVAVLNDVTGNLEPIYEKYLKPFQDLENMRWRDA